MKIAIITGRDPFISTDTDGGSVFIEYLMRQFDKVKDNVDVYIPSGVKGGLYSNKRARIQRGIVKNGKNINIIYFPVTVTSRVSKITQDENYFLERMKRSEEFIKFFMDKKLYSYDFVCILHVSNASGIVLHGLTPIEKTILFPMMTSANYELFSRVPIEYTQREGETLRTMNHICSPSDDEIEKIKTKFSVANNVLFKINRGFEESDFSPFPRFFIPSDGPIKLLCANGIRPQKDHLFLVLVANELVRRKVSFQIHLSGNDGKSHNSIYNAYTKKFWEEVRKHNLKSFFVSHGVVSRPNLAALMETSHIAIYASISETFGKSALESVVTGLPTIVCDDIPAFKEFILNNQTGIIVPRDASAWADTIIRLYSNKNLYAQISKNGILLRPQFTWNKVIQDFMTQLKSRKIINTTSFIEN